MLVLGREITKLADREFLVPPFTRRPIREQMQKLISDLEVFREVAGQNSMKNRSKYRRIANKGRKERQFYIGDKVFVYIPKQHPGFSQTMAQTWTIFGGC